jgi:hypothetical protein
MTRGYRKALRKVRQLAARLRTPDKPEHG